jgi:hypothetical protein
VLLMFFPGGLGEIVYRGRDAALRILAARRGLVVPSLLADKRTVAAADPMPVPVRLVTDDVPA